MYRMKRHPPKVAHVTEAFAGGVVTYLRNVLPALVRRGCSVTLICSAHRSWPRGPRVLGELATAGVAVRPLVMSRSIRPLADLIALWTMWRLFVAGRFDVVHTHASKAGLIGRIAARLAGVRLVVHSPHCFAFLRCDGRLRRAVYIIVERVLGWLTHTLIAVSPSECQTAVKLRILPRTKCRFVNNGLAPASRPYASRGDFHSEPKDSVLPVSPNSKVVATVCRLVKDKGVMCFANAARLSRTENAVFLFVGEGRSRPQLEHWVQDRGLQDRVRFLGYRDDMEALYQRVDLVVLCSRAEGESYVLLEAMRARRAIIATDVEGNSDLIVHGTSGHLVRAEPGEVAAAIDYLLSHGEIRAEYAANAYEAFRRDHRLDVQVSGLLDLYTVAGRDRHNKSFPLN